MAQTTWLSTEYRPATYVKAGFEVETDDNGWVRVTAVETTPTLPGQLVFKLADGSFFTVGPSDEIMSRRRGGAR